MNQNDESWPSFFQDSQFSEKLSAEFHRLQSHWGWFLAEGVALMVLGTVTISFSFFATIVSVAFLGWLFLLAGAVQSVRAFSMTRWSGSFVKILSGVLYVVAGILTIQNPTTSALMLTFLIAPLFIVSGILKTIAGITQRSPQWGWATLSGILAIVLGVLIWNQWPTSGLWVIGTLVGIEMLFSGISVVTFAVALKRFPNAPTLVKKAAA